MRKRHNLRKLIREALSELNLVTETMSLHIKGYQFPNRTDMLEPLCHHIRNDIMLPFINKMPKDQQDYFKKNAVGFYETLQPDGTAESYGPVGMINFYVSGFTSKALHTFLIAIFRELKRLGIKWGKLKREQSGALKSQVIRIPIVTNETKYEGAPEINFANSNAYHIFHNVLQYEGTHEFSMEAEELKQRIESLSHDLGWIDKHQKPNVVINPKEPVVPGDEWKESPPEQSDDDDTENPHDKHVSDISNLMGATLYSFGMSSQDLKNRLRTIHQFAEWAIKHGYKEIYVA